jgi:broad specificity phosphatase PhoE
MSIILIRHGETLLNAARVFQPFDTELGPRGLEQARLLAQRIADYAPVAILASDMPRAHKTAQYISEATGLALTTSTLLHERNFGDWRGQSHDSLGHDPATVTEVPPNGESREVFAQRVNEAFNEAVALRAKLQGPLVVVSHGLVIQTILENCVELGVQTMPHRIANTSVTVIDMEHPFKVHTLNCTLHLDGSTVGEDAKSLSGG